MAVKIDYQLPDYISTQAEISESVILGQIAFCALMNDSRFGNFRLYFFTKMENRKIIKVITKTNLAEKNSDYSYWQTKTYAERLAALEEIRQEYNNWKHTDAEQRFQRVYRVVKFKQS